MRRRGRRQLASGQPEVTGQEQRLIDTWFQDAAGSCRPRWRHAWSSSPGAA